MSAPLISASSTTMSWTVGSHRMIACWVPLTRRLRRVTFQALGLPAVEW